MIHRRRTERRCRAVPPSPRVAGPPGVDGRSRWLHHGTSFDVVPEVRAGTHPRTPTGRDHATPPLIGQSQFPNSTRWRGGSKGADEASRDAAGRLPKGFEPTSTRRAVGAEHREGHRRRGRGMQGVLGFLTRRGRSTRGGDVVARRGRQRTLDGFRRKPDMPKLRVGMAPSVLPCASREVLEPPRTKPAAVASRLGTKSLSLLH